MMFLYLVAADNDIVPGRREA